MVKHDPSPMNQEPPGDAESGAPPTAPDKSLLETYLAIEEALLAASEIPPVNDAGGE